MLKREGEADGYLNSTWYNGIQWVATTLQDSWQVISGNHYTQDPTVVRREIENTVNNYAGSREDTQSPTTCENGIRRSSRASQKPDSKPAEESPSTRTTGLGLFDCTNLSLPLQVSSPHLDLLRNLDWTATKLGPMETWSAELRWMCNVLMTDPRPAAMYWGQDKTILYNERYVEVIGKMHPWTMGKTFKTVWVDLLSTFEPVFTKAEETGQSSTTNDAMFFIDRNGYIEETYISWSMIPIGSENGYIAYYNPVIETTRTVIADRRLSSLLELGQFVAMAEEPKSFWPQLLKGLESNIHDFPFAILYSYMEEADDISMSSGEYTDSGNWTFEGAVGLPENHANAPVHLDSNQAAEEITSSFREAIRADTPTLLDTPLLGRLLKDVPSRSFGDLCQSAVICPIRPIKRENVLGFLVIGINPRKKDYDSDYQLFIQLLARQVATSLASVVLFGDEIRRGRIAAKMAAQEQMVLSETLAIRTQEAANSETRFRSMADLAPVGMFHIDPQGVVVYGNEQWFAITEHPKDVIYPMSWYNVFDERDHPLLDQIWDTLLVAGESISCELFMKGPLTAPELDHGRPIDRYVLCAAYPEKWPDGTTKGILGCLTDISRQKWVERFQKRRAQEAIEMKRQQENFIDMTSHEMRNPLGAIILCADHIATSLAEVESGTTELVSLHRELLNSHLEAAQTIALCAQHQKRIVDDVLTLSKLDSDLLLMTPVEAQPIVVIEEALKMFHGELQKSDVELQYRVDPSYSALDIDWVYLDPSRLLQVLINLVSNAIKFTQSAATRRITISVSASTQKPSGSPDDNGVMYLPRNNARKVTASDVCWEVAGQAVYLRVAVQDTGRGLDENEKKLLFQRFSQTTPRTHVEYGGSGLGLFISRELTELQGGEIGVASEAGVGSTFAFYIRGLRCAPPPHTATEQPTNVTAGDGPSKADAGVTDVGKTNFSSGDRTKSHVSASPVKSNAIKHVLIVEDNLVNQRVLSKQLRNAGCVISVANHGGEALAFLQGSRYWKDTPSGQPLSVILMDLEMPVMDGLTCVRQIRALQREGSIVSHVPVIAVTANARSEQMASAREAGMDSVVTKPFRIPELMPEIERLMSMYE
ncbi:putative histidine kinase M3YPp [Cryomyces antarcticus]